MGGKESNQTNASTNLCQGTATFNGPSSDKTPQSTTRLNMLKKQSTNSLTIEDQHDSLFKSEKYEAGINSRAYPGSEFAVANTLAK